MGKQRRRSTASDPHEDDTSSATMSDLQASLLEIESRESAPAVARVSRITTVPEVFQGLAAHTAGKKGQSHAVIQALTAVITEQGGDTIPVAYFALLLSSLPSSTQADELDVMLYLLRLVIPEISTAVLSAKLSEMCTLFQRLLSQYYETPLILVNTLKCVDQVFQRVAESSTSKPWTKQPKLIALYHSLLALSIDPRAKVRKEAHQVLHRMYDHPQGATTGKHSAKILSKFLLGQLVQPRDMPEEDRKKVVSYLLTLLTFLAAYLPLGVLSELLQVILAQMAQHANYLRTQGYVLLAALFIARPNPLQQDALARVLPQLEAIAPQLQDKLSIQSYADALANGQLLLHSLNPTMAAERLPHAVQHLLSLVLQVKYESYEPLFTAMEQMIEGVVDAAMLRQAAAHPGATSHLSQLGEVLRQGLSYQYESAWGFVLALLVPFFRKMDAHSALWMKPLIEALESFAKDSTARYHSIATQALRTAIQVLGPEVFLEILPLQFQLPLEAENRREWLLPCLQRAVEGAPLAFFGSYFMPLVAQLREEIQQAEAQENSFAAKHCRVLYTQVWDLLPAFCTFPTDVVENFKNLAKTMGTLLNEEEDLRLPLCLALDKLIQSNRALLPRAHPEFYLEEGDDEEDEDDAPRFARGRGTASGVMSVPAHIRISPEQAQANLNEVGRFAKNFFPILFNIFCGMEAHSNKNLRLRMALYHTIQAFASVAEQEVVDSFFHSVLRKILENPAQTKPDRRRQALLTELSQAFVEAASPAQLDLLFKIIKPQLGDGDIKVQKKSYQVLERLCCRTSYLSSHLNELKEVLIGNLSSAKAAAKKNRLRCLRYVTLALPGNPVDQLFSAQASVPASEVLAEIIVCVKEANRSAREEAFQLLILLHERATEATDDSSHFMQWVVAGLAGQSPHMISATVLALTRLAHESRDTLDPAFMESLYQTVLILFTTRNREIVKSCLGFVKSTCTILSVERLRANAQETINQIFLWINESKNRFRLKIKLILQKFITLLGYEELQFLVPAEHHKLLASVRRDMARHTKDKKEKTGASSTSAGGEDAQMSDDEDGDDSDSDSDSDNEFVDLFRGEPQRSTNEDGEDDDEDVVDLLDPKASKRLASQRHTKSAATKGATFAQDKSGRLLIPMDEEEDDATSRSTGKSIHQMVTESGGTLAPTRGKRSRLPDVGDEDEAGPSNEGPSKKKRKLATGDSSKYTGKEYRSGKGAGDVKVTGRYEPFAYHPMNPQLLNKRKQQKVAKHFKNVVSSAQKGATKGRKSRKKN